MRKSTMVALGCGAGAVAWIALAMHLRKRKQTGEAVACGVVGGCAAGGDGDTGALDNGFAQNLANKLNVEVYAPTDYLWSMPNGNYFVAGMSNSKVPDMSDIGSFKLFLPGGNQ